MALNFPYPAVDGQVFTSDGVVYVYSSTYSSWVISPAANTIVTLVSGTTGQIYSSGGYAPSLNLITTGVTANTYGGSSQIPVITVDAYGRLSSAANVAVQGMDYAYANTIGAASNGWANTVVAGANAWSNTKVSSVTGTAGQIYSSGGTTPTLNLIATTVTATTYGGASQIPVIAVDAYGRLTSASNVAVQGMDYAYANTIGASSNAWTNAVFGYSNSYTQTVGTAGNNYTITVGAASNGWTNTVVAGANAWSNAVFGYANTRMESIVSANAVSANAWTNTVFGYSNSYTQTVGTAGNNYTVTVGAASNSWANTIGASSNAWTNAVFGYANTSIAAANGWANTIGVNANTYANNTFLQLTGGTINGSLNISGNLTITGNTEFANVSTLLINDPLIYLAGNNYTSDLVDIGFVANYNNGACSTVHTGLFRDAANANKEWYLFQEYNKEPQNNVIDPNGNNFTISVLNATLRTSNVILNGANLWSWINNAYSQANAAPGISNSYAVTVGAASNGWSNTIFGYANTRMESIAAANAVSANAWTNAVFGYANTSIAAANGWANTVVAGANAWVNTSVAGANAWSNTKLSNTTTTLAGDLTISGQGGGIILTGSPLFQAVANVTQNSTISAGYNAMSPGPVTINSGYSVNVASGSVWTVV